MNTRREVQKYGHRSTVGGATCYVNKQAGGYSQCSDGKWEDILDAVWLIRYKCFTPRAVPLYESITDCVQLSDQ